MQQLKILNTREKKEILILLKEQFGFEEKLDYVFMLSSKEKLFIIDPDFVMLPENKRLKINKAGMYFGEYKNKSLRLSIEASQLIGRFAKKNIISLNLDQLKQWFSGLNINLDFDDNFVLLKFKDDFVGCGRIKDHVLFNFVPKIRRVLQPENLIS